MMGQSAILWDYCRARASWASCRIKSACGVGIVDIGYFGLCHPTHGLGGWLAKVDTASTPARGSGDTRTRWIYSWQPVCPDRVCSSLYASVRGGFSYYDPALITIYRIGFLLASAGLIFALGGARRPTALRWYSPALSIAMILLWCVWMSGE